MFTLSPAALVDGDLVVGASVRVERETLAYLLRLDANGEAVWATFLGSTPGEDYLALAPAGSPPLVSGNRIVYLSNRGFVALLHADDGDIEWIREYPTFTSRGLQETIRDEDRWHVSPVVAVGDDEVVIAPQDASLLLSLRLSTGAIGWTFPRQAHSALLGLSGDVCVLAGWQLSAVHVRGLQAGQLAWSTSLEAEGVAPRGRSRISGDRVLVSGDDALLHISVANGRLVARDLWDFPGGGGNLLRVGRRLVVTRAGGFYLYNDREADRARIATLAPNDPLTPLEQARFHLRAGDLERGLRVIESWQSTNPVAPEPNSALERLHLELGEILPHLAGSAEPSLATRLLRARLAVERIPARRVAAAIELARHHEARRDPGAAVAAYHRGLAFDSPPTEYRPPGGPTLPSEVYIRSQILRLRQVEERPDEVFRSVEDLADGALDSVHRRGRLRRESPAAAYFEFLREFPYTKAAAVAYLELARYYEDYENYERSAALLEEYLDDFPGREGRGRISLRTAQLLYRSGRRRDAKRLYRDLVERGGDEVVRGLHGVPDGLTVREHALRRLADPGLAEVALDASPDLRFPARMVWRSPADLLATNRIFLVPEGDPPPGMEEVFLTQSGEFIRCRAIRTGLPVWSAHLRQLPGFHLDPSLYGVHFVRSREKVIRGSFVGDLLVLHDHRNLFALDARRGTPRWNVPLEDGGSAPSRPSFTMLNERARGVTFDPRGVFVTTSWKRLYRYALDGKRLWTTDLPDYAAPHPPLLSGDRVWVIRYPRARLLSYRLGDGEEAGELPAAIEGDARSPLPAPHLLPGGRALVAFSRPASAHLRLVDLRRQRVIWDWSRPRARIREAYLSPDHPDEVVASLSLANNLPVLTGVSLRDGRERWTYDRFPAQPTTLSLRRDRQRLYVIHGDPTRTWKLLALEISHGTDRFGRLQVTPAWKPKEISLGMFFGASHRMILLSEDAVLFPDPNSISVYDKVTGKTVGEAQEAFNRFLEEKGSFTSQVLRGRLLILSDGGDAAFASDTKTDRGHESRRLLQVARSYFERPSSVEAISDLALEFFRQRSPSAIRSAIEILDHASLSEEVLLEGGPGVRDDLGYLLDGVKEEALKLLPPTRIIALRMHRAPRIDGKLDDAWDYAHRVRLGTPRHIGHIPRPGARRDWEGEEDLSAVVYTGWDDRFFYFALDVNDDVLRAYDKEAENWKGDCLLIGLDPDGDGGYRFQARGDHLMTLALTIPPRPKPQDDDEEEKPGDDGEEGEDGGDDDDDDEAETTPDGEFSVKKKDDNTGAIYEVALPWSTFSERFRSRGRPQRGYEFGLSLLLTDDDSGRGATKTLAINPCHLLSRHQKHLWIWKFLIPEFFPRVTIR